LTIAKAPLPQVAVFPLSRRMLLLLEGTPHRRPLLYAGMHILASGMNTGMTEAKAGILRKSDWNIFDPNFDHEKVYAVSPVHRRANVQASERHSAS
jgi:hypothetical protein